MINELLVIFKKIVFFCFVIFSVRAASTANRENPSPVPSLWLFDLA